MLMKKLVSETKRNPKKRKRSVKENDNMNNVVQSFWTAAAMFPVTTLLSVNQNYIVVLLANMFQHYSFGV